ncbi:uncharacterized protein LOC132193873 [Neocloeon triangulifer]|uniref:uncharacterized protein LOC132193873 n=1 Tax=Neocloeon triangulifer TaxID=2078957 RepID=UPI00286ED8FE|nr:uncharacterized protein LOC132193873 [Neocloeon triangulifer]
MRLDFITILVLFSFFVSTNAGNKRQQKIRKNGLKSSRRPMIIKCCGKSSCQPKISKTRFTVPDKNVSLKYVNSKKSTPIETKKGTTTTENHPSDEISTSFAASNEETSTEFIAIEKTTAENFELASTADTTDGGEVSGTATPSSKSKIDTTIVLTQTTSNPGSNVATPMMTTLSSLQSSAATITTSTIPTTTPPPQINLVYESFDSILQVKKDMNLFATDGTLKDAGKYGSWVHSCGFQYLFAKNLVNWTQNFVNCSKLGMAPLTFSKKETLQCFKNMTSDWKFTSNFWTSATRVSPWDFVWGKENVTVDLANVPWAFNQPDIQNKNQNCLQMNVVKGNSTIQFSDRVCSDSFFFSCQGAPTVAPECSVPVCPNTTCAKNPEYFKNSSSGSQYLDAAYKFGAWFTTDGRTYLFSKVDDLQTFQGADGKCCELGMSLLSLEYNYKYQALERAIKARIASEDFYWTSGSDKGCESKFGFCAVKRLLRDNSSWLSGQPDNAGGNESAVAVYVNETNVYLLDENEDKKLRYICEVRNNSNAKSGGTAIRDECAIIYNVSQIEIYSLFTNTYKYDLRIKCFLKCIGENAGVLVDGQVVDSDITKTLEGLANGNLAELQKNLLVVDGCQSSATGLDECDKAAQMIQCCNEKAPNALNAVINTMDQQMSFEKIEAAPPAFCPTTVCTVNTTVQQFTTCKDGCANDSFGYVMVLNRINYFFPITKVTFSNAFIECCKAGMKLGSLTQLEVNTLVLSSELYPLPDYSWTAASMINSSGNPRWCSSTAPFSTLGFDNVSISDAPHAIAVFFQCDVNGTCVNDIKSFDPATLLRPFCFPL